jgi:hypothetical protein
MSRIVETNNSVWETNEDHVVFLNEDDFTSHSFLLASADDDFLMESIHVPDFDIGLTTTIVKQRILVV